MWLALRLARRGYGATSPNPMVGAVLVRNGKIIGRGWHRSAGRPHAEIEALRDAERRGNQPAGATLYVTLEPCCTHGRTPPCTDAIIAARIKKVVVAATDPNPAHRGKAFRLLRRKGIQVLTDILAAEATRLNEAFNHWIVHHTPFVIVKSAMTLDGKIATASGESKWITGPRARQYGMKLRAGADAILVGINTILADDPQLTARQIRNPKSETRSAFAQKQLRRDERKSEIRTGTCRRIVLDSRARTPLIARVVSDEDAELTTVVVTKSAPQRRVETLSKRVNVLIAPERDGRIDLKWLMVALGKEEVTSLLVEGGGEVNASFLLGGLAHRVAFFYAPKILGGRDARKAVAGEGVKRVADMIRLADVEWRKFGPDLLLSARVA